MSAAIEVGALVSDRTTKDRGIVTTVNGDTIGVNLFKWDPSIEAPMHIFDPSYRFNLLMSAEQVAEKVGSMSATLWLAKKRELDLPRDAQVGAWKGLTQIDAGAYRRLYNLLIPR